MALKGNWKDLQDAIQGVADSGDDASSEPINRIAHAVIEIEEQLENGGGSGEDGATFIPNVSQDGVISWTNNKGLQNPSSINLVDAVLAALPNGDEVSY